MTIADQLSSARGERGQAANVAVARRCVRDPSLLEDIAAALREGPPRLAADAAEVLTKVAEEKPELVVPHLDLLLAGVRHRNGRVRWESAHAVALVAPHAARRMEKELDALAGIFRRDPGVIVRDYVLDTIAAVGTSSGKSAPAAFALLEEALPARGAKHAARALAGMARIVARHPSLAVRARSHAEALGGHARPSIAKAARALRRQLAS